MLNIRFKLFVILFAGLIFVGEATSEIKGTGDPNSINYTLGPLNKGVGIPISTLSNVNNISMWIRADGWSARNPTTGGSGVNFPRGIRAGVIFADGLVWTGLVQDGQTPELRAGGQTYAIGTVQGRIISQGVAEDPDAADVRIWRIRRNYPTADLRQDAADLLNTTPSNVTSGVVEGVRTQYRTDWEEWPAEKGAPFYDADGDGIYTPQFEGDNFTPILYPIADEPGLANADQVVWFVANDLRDGAVRSLYGSPSIGLEMQVTLWAYEREHAFGNAIFKRYKLIYKGTSSTPGGAIIDSMYVAQWSDPDLGSFRDDYVGVDTLQSLGYVYNSSAIDNAFHSFNLPPPAAGYVFLQGPIVASPGDTATFDFGLRPGYKNLSMSSFVFFAAGTAITDPPLGTYEGTTQWRNLHHGLRPDGQPYIDPTTGLPELFTLYGDPVARTGWLDSGAADRRMVLNTGPFEMALGDTQEVLYALLADIGTSRTLYLRSIDRLKKNAKTLKGLIVDGLAVDIIGKDLVRTNELVELSSAWVSLDPAASIASYEWSFDAIPSGSATTLDSTDGESTTFTPDLEGFYIVSLTLTTTAGSAATVLFDLFATENQPPVAQFIINQTDITWGDSVFVNASISSDPENDSLEYFWQAEGLIHPIDDGSTAQITPFSSGNIPISLVVSDGIFESETSQTITVHPRTENITIDYSFVDTSWTREIYYFHGDTLLVPIHDLGIIRVYDISDIGIVSNTDITLPGAVRAVRLRDDRLYMIVASGDESFFGSGGLSIFSVGNGWELTPLLENYRPGNGFFSEIVEVTFLNEHVVIIDRASIYKIDFTTNPSVPNILAEVDYSLRQPFPMRPMGVEEVGDYLYVSVTGFMPRAIEVLNKTTLDSIKTLNSVEGFRNFSVHDDLMFVGFFDSLVVYEVSDPLQPIKLSAISISSPINFLDFINTHSGRHIQNDLLSVQAFGGVKVFNIQNPATPQPVASWYGGVRGQSNGVDIRYHDGAYYVTTEFGGLQTSEDPYSGINRISFLPVSVDDFDNGNIPEKYALSQNYPNPFNPETTIKYQLPFKSDVKLVIYNLLGQEVFRLERFAQQAGEHLVRWDGRNMQGSELSSGIYFYRLQASDFVQTKKMVLLK